MRLARAILAELRAAGMIALEYRLSFLGEALMATLWAAWSVVPLLVVFRFRAGIAGWSADQALLVMGFFLTLEGLMGTFIEPNLQAVVEHVRRGTLDFVLLKPIDSQLLVSVQRTSPTRIPHALAGLIVVGVASSRLDVRPGWGDLALAGLLLIAGFAVLHALYTLAVSSSFWFVRVDNLSYLLQTGLEAGRWPVAFYRGAVRFALTFLLPVGIMTTWPALAIRGLLTAEGVLGALAVAATFLVIGRLTWKYAVRRYSSASS